ncbi:Chromosome transmission fidelity protein 8-like [Hondaea fermentalgiana]|uniref:Chromosome transmission fidelity protein 8-like n=1 Tax=Hondaea fermentalgiana TaxID=2315210 RepID=A0A2R5GSL1_9STRA|nr:Chromosome transmission fidelity protein 8-like [Hondaea fermentalgiana]|eukprot:GBG33852.1 Chromosome transmission fidelity protein 8-like [Hondaea fermentalgiana]
MAAVAPPLARAVCLWPPEDEVASHGGAQPLADNGKTLAPGAAREWAMIELQGTLAVAHRKNADGEDCASEEEEEDDNNNENDGNKDDEYMEVNDNNNEKSTSAKRKKATAITLEHQGLGGQTLGELTFDNGVPILEIGVHRLEGKIVKIPKPFAVIERIEDHNSAANNIEDSDQLPVTKFAVRGIIRQKILFKTRPKPLVGKRARLV